MKYVNLIHVDPIKNTNKFYTMEQKDSDSFTATNGRVGTGGVARTYPMSDWEAKYREKIRKGYTDNTDNTAVKQTASAVGQVALSPISNKEVEDLIKRLQSHSAKTIAANYTIKPVKVTEKAIDEAQELINQINGILKIDADIDVVNMKLVKLYKVLPRKIKRVQDAIIQFPLTDQKILSIWTTQMDVEQQLLDTLRTEVHTFNAVNGNVPGPKAVVSILDQLGLEIDVVDRATEQKLKSSMGISARKFIKAFKVENTRSRKQFVDHLSGQSDKTVEQLFHGSRAENWLSILEDGLRLRPNAITNGKLFGYGIYFANNADKSLGYINGARWTNGVKTNDSWLAVFDVHIGNALVLDSNSKTERYSEADYSFIKKKGHDSLYVKGGYMYNAYTPLMRDEIIVYKEEQCTISYLIQIDH
jgi:poly [ADP-ribose] polymerase 2/3/4